MNTYAVYELGETNEAVAVHFYCSQNHAETDIKQGTYGITPTATGADTDWPDGAICERCGVALSNKGRVKKL
jgi:hypothetical protein